LVQGAAGGESLYWAHPIPQPERGCVLIAHPLMFTTSQQYFSQARRCICPSPV
jgi:putative transcriptional regulator